MNIAVAIHTAYRAAEETAFEWGGKDCLGWCALVAEVITGKDPIAHIRGRYDSEIGAKRVMVEEGWNDIGDVAGSCYQEVHASRARSGDWAMVLNLDGSDVLGVVSGSLIAARTMSGMAKVSIRRAHRVFRVE